MKKLLLGLAFIGFIVTSSYASVSTITINTVVELSEDGGECDKCGKEKCDKKSCSATADKKKACTSSKKACCAKKADAKKACCSKDSGKKCSKSAKAAPKADDKTKE